MKKYGRLYLFPHFCCSLCQQICQIFTRIVFVHSFIYQCLVKASTKLSRQFSLHVIQHSSFGIEVVSVMFACQKKCLKRKIVVKSSKPLNCASALTETDESVASCVHVKCVCMHNSH